MDLRLHDIAEFKKPHPCGSVQWEILRVGMDIKLRCLKCGREMMSPRNRIEKSIRKIIRNPVTRDKAEPVTRDETGNSTQNETQSVTQDETGPVTREKTEPVTREKAGKGGSVHE